VWKALIVLAKPGDGWRFFRPRPIQSGGAQTCDRSSSIVQVEKGLACHG